MDNEVSIQAERKSEKESQRGCCFTHRPAEDWKVSHRLLGDGDEPVRKARKRQGDVVDRLCESARVRVLFVRVSLRVVCVCVWQ